MGREREVADLEERLTGEARLLTLIGPGGCGKTRLALSAASRLAGGFEDGVWWVDLAPLSDPDFVPQVVAQTLGVREAPDRPLTETLVGHLRSREMLLTMDNCEHLVEGCAALADTLLRSCPGVRILATSREVLGIAGENTWLVPSLTLPDREQRLPVEELRRREAISLFVERANAVASDFELTEHNAPAVGRVCQMLDGMPLAIELAAARVRVLSVEQISSRLEDSFGLLTGGSRTALPRQRTLRAAIDGSYELLSEEERVLLRRLSVFAGGFGLEAVEEVCSGEVIEEGDVLDPHSHLVDKSIVLVVEQDGEVRYRVLETVRQYGREKLEKSGEDLSIRRHHAEFFLELAERVEPKINGKDRGFWLERLDAEHDNFRAALAWSREETELEKGLRLASVLLWFWFHCGYWSEGRRWLDGAIVADESAGRPVRIAVRAKALSTAGHLACMQGDNTAARSRLEESVALWREVGDKQGLAHALRFLSGGVESQGDYALVRSLAEESVELFREGTDTFGLGMALARLGSAALTQGDHAAARAALEEGVAICRETRDDWVLALALRNLGIAALRQGHHEQASALLKESLAMLWKPGEKLYNTQSLDALAAVVSMQGDHARAAWLFGAAEALREAVGASVLPFYRADYDRGVVVASAGLTEATFSAAWSEGHALTPEEAVEYALGTEELATLPTKDAAMLSAREIEVLVLVAEGMTDPQVAQKLYLSPRTVGQHLCSIYRKLGVPSRAAAAREALQRGLI